MHIYVWVDNHNIYLWMLDTNESNKLIIVCSRIHEEILWLCSLVNWSKTYLQVNATRPPPFQIIREYGGGAPLLISWNLRGDLFWGSPRFGQQGSFRPPIHVSANIISGFGKIQILFSVTMLLKILVSATFKNNFLFKHLFVSSGSLFQLQYS